VGAVAALVLGVAAVGVGAELAVRPPQVAVTEAGSIPDTEVAAARAHTAARQETSPTSAAAAPAPSPTEAPAVTAPLPAVGGSPVAVSAPGTGIAAEVVPVGVRPSGALEIPEDGRVVGWWSSGAAPGAASGSVVLAGHVDTTAGVGVMLSVLELPLNALVDVTDDSGRTTTYRTVARRAYDKDDGLPADLFRVDGPPQLALVTCGGTFDARTGHYSDNVVVLAVPA
jgi:hypothetical protein